VKIHFFVGRGYKTDNDVSVKTFGNSHAVQHTLIRCFFSPMFNTGQTMIYTGCASGACVGENFNNKIYVVKFCRNFQIVFSLVSLRRDKR